MDQHHQIQERVALLRLGGAFFASPFFLGAAVSELAIIRVRLAARSSGRSLIESSRQPLALLLEQAFPIADVVGTVGGNLLGQANRLIVERGRIGGETELEQLTGGRSQALHLHLLKISIRIAHEVLSVLGTFDQKFSGVLQAFVADIDRDQALGGPIVEIDSLILRSRRRAWHWSHRRSRPDRGSRRGFRARNPRSSRRWTEPSRPWSGRATAGLRLGLLESPEPAVDQRLENAAGLPAWYLLPRRFDPGQADRRASLGWRSGQGAGK